MANCPPPANPSQPPIDAEYWDRPTAELVADGHPMIAIWAVKDAMLSLGCTLDYPPPEVVNNQWAQIDTSEGGV